MKYKVEYIYIDENNRVTIPDKYIPIGFVERLNFMPAYKKPVVVCLAPIEAEK